MGLAEPQVGVEECCGRGESLCSACGGAREREGVRGPSTRGGYTGRWGPRPAGFLKRREGGSLFLGEPESSR